MRWIFNFRLFLCCLKMQLQLLNRILRILTIENDVDIPFKNSKNIEDKIIINVVPLLI